CFLIVEQTVHSVRPEKNPLLILSRANRMCCLSNLQKTAKIKHHRTARQNLLHVCLASLEDAALWSVPARILGTSAPERSLG
ncbi:MAG: hypothetical protein ACI4HI_14935, partial [Lachnospiraceae bacterium]